MAEHAAPAAAPVPEFEPGFELVNPTGKLEAHVFDEPHDRPEWFKVLAGQPMEDRSLPMGGMAVLTVREWAARWRVRRSPPRIRAPT